MQVLLLLLPVALELGIAADLAIRWQNDELLCEDGEPARGDGEERGATAEHAARGLDAPRVFLALLRMQSRRVTA